MTDICTVVAVDLTEGSSLTYAFDHDDDAITFLRHVDELELGPATHTHGGIARIAGGDVDRAIAELRRIVDATWP